MQTMNPVSIVALFLTMNISTNNAIKTTNAMKNYQCRQYQPYHNTMNTTKYHDTSSTAQEGGGSFKLGNL